MSPWVALTNPNHSHPQWMYSTIPGSPGLNRGSLPTAIYQLLFTNCYLPTAIYQQRRALSYQQKPWLPRGGLESARNVHGGWPQDPCNRPLHLRAPC
jgi:hypothetical protein